MTLTYVTSNPGKAERVKQIGKEKQIDIQIASLDIEELEVSNVEIVSLDKAKKAFEKIKKQVFVEDSGFYIDGYPNKKNYPGTLVKRSGISSNIEKLLDDMKDVSNRYCYFVSCVTYYDGNIIKQFLDYSYGLLSYDKKGQLNKEARSRLWEVFIPEGYSKTLAEMTPEEREERREKQTSAFSDFIEWYQENFLSKKNKKYQKIIKKDCIKK